MTLPEESVVPCPNSMRTVYILSAVRTPIGKYGGSLAGFTAPDLGVVAAQAALQRAQVPPEEVNEVIFGHARQAGNGPNPARQIAVRAGVPVEVPAYTVNQACASGMKAIALGCDQILMGRAEVLLAGGTEAMSRVPYFVDGGRWGARLGHQELVDGMYRDGFLCPLSRMVMGETADLLAAQYRISREEQDAYAFCSQRRAADALACGRFSEEIAPMIVRDKKGERTFMADEHPRAGTTLQSLAELPAVFSKSGTVTAGNASGITDGAAAVVLGSEDWVRRSASTIKTPLARIVDYSVAGVDPKVMGLGPVPAIHQLLKRTGRRLEDYDLVELNEAFAAQVLACDRELHFDRERLNVNGGAIALGHPIGCTGARITVTLLHAMGTRKARRGLATLCVSGGLGMALEIESNA